MVATLGVFRQAKVQHDKNWQELLTNCILMGEKEGKQILPLQRRIMPLMEIHANSWGKPSLVQTSSELSKAAWSVEDLAPVIDMMEALSKAKVKWQ